MKTSIAILTLLSGALLSHAQIVVQYSAADGNPSSQGFTEIGNSSIASTLTTYQNEAVWRTEDAQTDQAGYSYTRSFTTSEISTLQSRGYRISARVAFLNTSYDGGNSCNFHFADGSRRFLVHIDETTNNKLNLYLPQNSGGLNIEIDTAVNDLYNIDIDVEPGGASASLLVNGEVMTTGWTGQDNTSTFLRFGNSSTGGQGAAAWNRVQIASRVLNSDMNFIYLSSSDSYELDTVNDVAGHLHIPNTWNDGTHGEKNVTEVGSEACSPNFVGHKSLVSLRFPAQLTSLGTSTFQNCSGFTSLTLHAGLNSIGTQAFYQCSGLSGPLTIPAGVTSIGNEAFRNCGNLVEVCWFGAPPTLSTDVFLDTPASGTLQHFVPSDHLAAYQTLGGTFATAKVTRFLIAISFSAGNAVLSFDTESGSTYQVQRATDLITPNWSSDGSAINGDGTSKTAQRTASGTHGYFRVQVN